MGPISERDQIMGGWKRDATAIRATRRCPTSARVRDWLSRMVRAIKILEKVENRSEVPSTLDSFYKKRILRTAAVQGLGRMNSEAIKILTPLLPIRPGGILAAHFCHLFIRGWVLLLVLPAEDGRGRGARARGRHARSAQERGGGGVGRGRGAGHAVDRSREQTRKSGA